MIAVLLAQVILPLVLLAWLAVRPAASVLGWVLQLAAIGVLLLALALIAQWAVPVWWLPRLYGGLWLLTVLMQSVGRRTGERSLFPTGPRGWAALVLSVGLLGTGLWFGALAFAGRDLPSVVVIDVANPLGPGHYLVGHGGSNEWVNGHVKTLDASVERFTRWRGQSYGVDFFGLGRWGLRARGWWPDDPAAYAIFGAALRAPCTGTVFAAEGALPDLRPPRMDLVNRLGNHVILRCGEADIVLAHLRHDSLTVAPGDKVTSGDWLGEVGNSGASSEPHLHIHAQRPPPDGAPAIAGEPLALRIDGRFLIRGDRLAGHLSSVR